MKAPPFLRQSANHLESGWNRDRTLWICFGPHAWDEAKRRSSFQLIAVLPPGSSPTGFDWRLTAKFPAPIILVQAGDAAEDLQGHIARQLVLSGCKRVLGEHPSGCGQRWVAQEVSHAA